MNKYPHSTGEKPDSEGKLCCPRHGRTSAKPVPPTPRPGLFAV